ncbi:MAG: alcohol dehydrogenase catalytic domain-containing protein [Solirubrobacterales bacterium]
MLAVTSHGDRDIRVEEVEKPGLRESTDALVRVTTSALCGTDMHIYHGKVPNVPDGWIVGHEFCGVVEEIGDGVTNIAPGDRVVSAMYTACGACAACVAGNHRACPNFAMFGMGESWGALPGGQAEYVRVPLAGMTLRGIPGNLSDESTIFTGDILATAFTALRQSDTSEGDTVAVVGAGPVGQMIAMCASLFGVARAFIIDIVPERLAESERFGVTTINPTEQDPRELIKEQTDGRMCDTVFEAVGSAPALKTAFSLPRPNGVVALVGMPLGEQFPLGAGDAWLRNTKIIPILGSPFNHRDELLRLIAAGKIDAASVITDRVPLSDASEAYRAFDNQEVRKVVFEVST